MIIDYSKMPFDSIPGFKGGEGNFDAKMFFDGTNRILYGKLEPGCSIGEHTHEDSSEMIYYLEGKGTVIYDGETLEVSAGMCHYCPKGHTHTMINTSDAPLVFFAVVPQQ